ncbi:MAG: YkvA family protein [Planctomycetota bacterium]|jgi:uncharacterized membrane protein YkvA (DUF1232 family)
MNPFSRLKGAYTAFRGEIAVYRKVVKDRRTPLLAKVLLGLAVAYALSPVDLIPDCLPGLGHLDDLIVVPLLVWLALKLVPEAVVREARGEGN